MNLREKLKCKLSRLPIVRLALLGIFIGWLLLSTVTPVPAPPPGNGGDPVG